MEGPLRYTLRAAVAYFNSFGITGEHGYVRRVGVSVQNHLCIFRRCHGDAMFQTRGGARDLSEDDSRGAQKVGLADTRI
jgi:hypothetical protein